jgi:hypothetical protein
MSKKGIQAEKAWELVGGRLSDDQVRRLNELQSARQTRNLTFAEQEELHILEHKPR